MNAQALARPTWRLEQPNWTGLLPVAVAAVTQVEVWAPYGVGHLVGPRPVIALVYAISSAALFWRRRAPLAVLAFVLTLDAAQDLAFGAPEGLGTFLPPLFAFYAVGRYASTSSLVLAAPLVALGTAVHEVKDPEFAVAGSAAFWVILASAWPLGQAFRRRAADADRLADHARALEREREQLARAAVVDERARIARELHDVVGHAISVVVLQLVAGLELLDAQNTAAARSRLLGGERSARQALAEMRRLLGLLDDPDHDAPLAPRPGMHELGRLLADTRAAGAELDVEVGGEPSRELPAGVDLAAFRILQESLTNVLKHARPPHARVHIGYEAGALTVAVIDDGRETSSMAVPGRGIAGMRERVALYGGELELGPRPQGGFAVRACLPVQE
jgi:signal transduction histidine kinase